jgi:hypothetical protein
MNANPGRLSEDWLATLGVAAGGFLILVGLATIAGTPWTHGNLLAGLIQMLGAALAVAIGAALAWLARA